MELTKLFTNYEFLDDEAFATASANDPLRKWIKFTFTDDQPNGNKQRIGKEEFKNIIRTGIHMPIKMADGNPKGDHEGSIPLGTITNLKEEENKVIGIAALWKEERPEDIQALEEAYAGGKPLDLSWELYFDKEASLIDDNGIQNLKGTTVRSSVFVGNPAYQGRTQVLTMAQQENTNQEENELTDTNTPDVAALEARVAELQAELDTVKSELQSKVAELESASSELTSLRKTVEDASIEKAQAETLKTRRTKLAEAGVTYSDEEFETKKDNILGMTEEAFLFHVQELNVFSSKAQQVTPASAGINNPIIPDLTKVEKDAKTVLRESLGLSSK